MTVDATLKEKKIEEEELLVIIVKKKKKIYVYIYISFDLCIATTVCLEIPTLLPSNSNATNRTFTVEGGWEEVEEEISSRQYAAT